jgi:LysM repeat protein
MPYKKFLALGSLFLLFSSCSLFKSDDEKPLLDLTLQEMQTGIDDSRHQIHCFQTDLQIVDGKIKQQEDLLENLKKEDQKSEKKVDVLEKNLQEIKAHFAILEKKQKALVEDLKQLASHQNESASMIAQFKSHTQDLEREIVLQNKKIDEINQLKLSIQALMDSIKKQPVGLSNLNSSQEVSYRVMGGDSLEKIAKKFNVTVESIKKVNRLEEDLIVVGQEILIPVS